MAADPDPYFALPRLYGAPAHGRVLRAVPVSERPFDPDDLPIAAEQTDDERDFARALRGVGSATAGWAGAAGVGASSPGSSRGGDNAGSGASRFSLRGLTGRLGPRAR